MGISPAIRVLFVDDNPDLCTVFSMLLEAIGGFSVSSCTSAAAARERISAEVPDAIISDYAMPVMNGIQFLREVKAIHPDIPFIILTGEDSKETAIDALNTGADFYQNKSEAIEIQIRDIAQKIRLLVSQRDAEEAIRRRDAILEAVTYAAERYLKGSVGDDDSAAILSRLGAATKTARVCMYHRHPAAPESLPICDLTASWSEDENIPDLPPCKWPREWFIRLSESPDLLIPESGISGLNEPGLPSGLHSILILSIRTEEMLWGYLVFLTTRPDLRRSALEIQTLRMASDLIGAAQYRRYIEDVYKSPVEEAMLGVFILSPTSFTYVNPRLCEILGYDREELFRMENPCSIIDPAEEEVFRDHIRMTLEGTDPSLHFESTGIRKDGRQVFLDIYLTTSFCENVPCIVGNVIDISDRREIQQSLRESEERCRLLAEQIEDLIMVIDTDFHLSYGNPAARRTFAHTSIREGMDIREALNGEEFRGFLEILSLAVRGEIVRTGTVLLSLPGTRKRWYDITITPLLKTEGRLSSVVVFFHDVSSRVQQEEEIRREGLAQIELNMEQFQILNDEIRNPLQVVRGYNLLQGGEYQEKIDEQLSIINGLIDKLDQAWVRSEKIHSFLLRHYRHGFFLETGPDR